MLERSIDWSDGVSQRRKLAAILSADAVGYSRFMGQDERANS
jgi:hypothetical protein